jgi:hypothetical protein
MAQVTMPTFTDGMQVHDTDLTPLRSNIADHETRMLAAESTNTTQTTNISTINGQIGALSAGSPAHNRLNALETITGAATSGNADLNTRLGAGVGTTANVTTGTVTAQNNDLRSRMTSVEGRATALETITSTERNSTTATALANGSQVDVPFPNSAQSSSDITYAAPVFTVARAGVYAVESTVRTTGGALEINLWYDATGGGTYRRRSGNVTTTMGVVATTMRMPVGAKLKVTALNTSGAAKTIETGAEETTHISIVRLGG